MLKWFTITAVLFVSWFHWGPSFHGSRGLLGLVLASIAIGAIAWRRAHWSAGIALAWVLISSALVFAAPESPFLTLVGLGGVIPGGLSPQQALAVSEARRSLSILDTVTAVTFLSVLAYTLPVMLASRRVLNTLVEGFGWLCLVDSAFVIYQRVHGDGSYDSCGGFFGNYSLNACVIAFTYPILHRQTKPYAGPLATIWGWVLIIVPCVAIVLSRSNMALLALAAAFVVPHLACIRRVRIREILWLIIEISGFGLVGWLCMGHKLGQDSGRFETWRAFISWWWEHANHWIGTGAGTWFILGPHVQAEKLGQMTGGHFWVFNELLGVVLETGFIGGALVALMYVMALWNAVRAERLWVLSALSAYGVASLGSYPAHLPIPGLIGAVLIAMAFGCGDPFEVL